MENEFEELEMDTGPLYLVLAEDNFGYCVLPEMEAQWMKFRQIDRRNDFIADAKVIFFHLLAAVFDWRKLFSDFFLKYEFCHFF